MGRRRHETDTELLLDHLACEVGVGHVYDVMLVPLLGDVAGHVVHKYNEWNGVYHTAVGLRAHRMGHLSTKSG